jgi:hypothetical protein
VTWEAYNYDELDAPDPTSRRSPLPDSYQLRRFMQTLTPKRTTRRFLHHFAEPQQQRDAASLGMWVFLATEVMFFGGLFCAYLVYRRWYFGDFAAASKSINMPLGATNTAVLICSSLTVVLAVWAAQTARRTLLIVSLILTMLLGLTFLGIKASSTKTSSKSITCPARPSVSTRCRSQDIPISTPTRATRSFSSPSTSS